MGRRREEQKPQRFLLRRGGTFYYYRRVPSDAVEFDSRAPYIRMTLKTSDLGKAMALRDIHERADNDFWASLIVGTDAEVAARRYSAVVARARALGFAYKTAAELALEPLEVRLERIERVAEVPVGSVEETAILGLVEKSDEKISVAVQTYIDHIARDEIRNKSPEQKRIWSNIKKQAVANFVELCGDLAMGDIAREHALKFYDFWMDRVAPKVGRPTHTASSGNKQLGTLRGLYRDWAKHHGKADIKNPFDGLSFVERKSQKKKRPPFSVGWIKDVLLREGALSGLNSEARGVFLTLVETGARLSEICNLKPENIILGGKFPHIKIEPSEDPDDPREIKTESSIRVVPLVGVSLAAMKKHAKGFPRYRDRGSALSGTINKYLRENKLLETPKHKAYSLRHSFEDRMKDGGLDTELRMMLMGHAIDRPDYGEGGSLKWKYEELSKIVLPFDSKIV